MTLSSLHALGISSPGYLLLFCRRSILPTVTTLRLTHSCRNVAYSMQECSHTAIYLLGADLKDDQAAHAIEEAGALPQEICDSCTKAASIAQFLCEARFTDQSARYLRPA